MFECATASGLHDGGAGDFPTVADRLRVRNARTGRVIAVLDGTFRTDWVLHRSVVWESNRMLVLVAYDGWEPDVEMGFVAAGRDLVRCNVRAAACRRVGDPHPWRTDAIAVRRD